MDVYQVLGAAAASGVISVGVAHWLAGRLVDHRLSKDLKDYDARIRKDVEEYLGERSAERSYREEARKRLYLAVGPLRFQLLVAAAELASRVARIGDGNRYNMDKDKYFAQSTVYRLLRVLAIGELIERQVAYADFAVDPEMRSLLRCKRECVNAWSSDRVSLGHPQENWNRQAQHLFSDVLAMLGSSMIRQEGAAGTSRVMRFDEFAAEINGDDASRFEPVPTLLHQFTPQSKPLLWLRLLAMAQLCNGLLQDSGEKLGLDPVPLDPAAMLSLTQDPHIESRRAEFLAALDGFRRALVTNSTGAGGDGAGRV